MNSKKQQIIDTASMLFSTNGIKKTTVELISRECGISKKTFYIYFRDKETIINEIVKSAINRTENYILKLTEQLVDAPLELINFFNFIQSTLTVFSPAFMCDLLKFHPEINNLISQARRKKFLPFFILNVQKGIQEGSYRQGVDGELTGELYFRQIDAAIDDDSLSSTQKIEVLNYINVFFLYGIVNGTGAKFLCRVLKE